ncbi:MAG: hypothetical protein KAW92_10745 [Candidatus Cloacimonetes bacterium]|nr:hypothetical protein [Candidatus Cloacimonadota bacterium]
MKSLILLHGKARSGKGEVAKRLCEKYGYVEVGFADYLKELAVEVFGWDPSEIWINRTPASRKFMQLLGNEIGRAKNFDFWIKKLEERLKGKYKGKNIVVSDLRYWNEAEWGKNSGGQLWYLWRSGAKKMIEGNPEHASEQDLENWKDWDYTIINDGTIEDLYREVDGIIEKDSIEKKKEEVKSNKKKNVETRALLLQDLIEIFVDSPMDGQTLNRIVTGLDAFGWKKVGTFPLRKWKGLH